MKRIVLFAILLTTTFGYSQSIITYEKPPVFSECDSEVVEQLKSCFNYTLNTFIYENFKVPQIVADESYVGNVQILFEVNKEGEFKIIYSDAIYDDLKAESKRVFDALPKIQPATYNGNPTFIQYSITIAIPLVKPNREAIASADEVKLTEKDSLNAILSNEFENVNKATKPYEGLEYKSELNVPFTHSYYARFDAEMNALGTNSHTAAKPFIFSDVARYYDIKAEKESLAKDTDTWLGRKLFNEHLVQVQGKDYWFTVDPILDLQVGKDGEADFNSTYNNTRGIYIQGRFRKTH